MAAEAGEEAPLPWESPEIHDRLGSFIDESTCSEVEKLVWVISGDNSEALLITMELTVKILNSLGDSDIQANGNRIIRILHFWSENQEMCGEKLIHHFKTTFCGNLNKIIDSITTAMIVIEDPRMSALNEISTIPFEHPPPTLIEIPTEPPPPPPPPPSPAHPVPIGAERASPMVSNPEGSDPFCPGMTPDTMYNAEAHLYMAKFSMSCSRLATIVVKYLPQTKRIECLIIIMAMVLMGDIPVCNRVNELFQILDPRPSDDDLHARAFVAQAMLNLLDTNKFGKLSDCVVAQVIDLCEQSKFNITAKRV